MRTRAEHASRCGAIALVRTALLTELCSLQQIAFGDERVRRGELDSRDMGRMPGRIKRARQRKERSRRCTARDSKREESQRERMASSRRRMDLARLLEECDPGQGDRVPG
jgi:hypothetical protein